MTTNRDYGNVRHLMLPKIFSRLGYASFGSALTPFTYLVRDRFDTPYAAPLSVPFAADPGPGIWSVLTDTGAKFSISSGALQATGITAADNPRIYVGGTGVARATGIAFACSFVPYTLSSGAALNWLCGLHTVTTQRPFAVGFNIRNLPSLNNLGVVKSSAQATTFIHAPLITGSLYRALVVMLPTAGAYWFLQHPNDVIELVMKDFTATWAGNAFVGMGGNGGTTWTTPIQIGEMAALNLTANGQTVWSSTRPAAETYQAGPVAAGISGTHTANSIHSFKRTAGTDAITYRFRIVDASNYWSVRVLGGTGTVTLTETVAGVDTLRLTGSSALGASGTNEVIIFMRDDYIALCLSGVSIWLSIGVYASATNFQTATGWELTLIGGNTIVDLDITPLRVPAGAVYDAVAGVFDRMI